MKIEYDPEVDALYIAFRDVPPASSLDIEEGVTVDLDGEKHIIGIEILDASERLQEHLYRIELSGLPFAPDSPLKRRSAGLPAADL